MTLFCCWIDGEEFEIKGDGATLGEKPAAFPVDLDKLSPFGLKKVGQKYEIGDGEDIEIVGNLNKFAFALSLTYKQTKDKNGFKNALKETLTKMSPIIFMEYAPYALKEYGTSIDYFYSFLSKNNYQVFDLKLNKIDKIKIREGSSVDIVLIKNS